MPRKGRVERHCDSVEVFLPAEALVPSSTVYTAESERERGGGLD